MKRYQVFISSAAVLGLSLWMAACNSGGSRALDGEQCPAAYEPGYQQVPPANSKPFDPKAGDIDLDPGKYVYLHADFVYEEKKQAQFEPFKIHVQDALQKDGVTYGQTVICVRNSRPEMNASSKEFVVSSPGLSAITIDPLYKPTDLVSKTYGFHVLPGGKIMAETVPTIDQKPTLPTDPYKDATSTYVFVHPENPNVVEIRSSGNSADGGVWHLSTFFLRTDLPKVSVPSGDASKPTN